MNDAYIERVFLDGLTDPEEKVAFSAERIDGEESRLVWWQFSGEKMERSEKTLDAVYTDT